VLVACLVVAPPAVRAMTIGATAKRIASDSADLDAVRAVLRARLGEDGRTEREVVRELAALGPDAVPELFALVNGRATRRLAKRPAAAAGWWCSPDRFAALARSALGRMPAQAVLAQLDATTFETDADRVAALRVLADLGSARGLATVFSIASGFDELALRSPTLQRPFEDALIAILRSDPESWSRLQGTLARQRPALLTVAARAVSEANRPEGVRTLASLLRHGGPPEEDLLARIADLAYRHAWRAAPVAEDVRAYLTHEHPKLRAAGARALARMGDTASLPELAELLGDDSPQVRGAASSALRELTGTALPMDAETWNAWLTAEGAWWVRERERLTDAITAEEPARVLAAVRELATRPALRHETGMLLTHALGSTEPVCLVATCSALAAIGYGKAVPALGMLLFESDEDVRRAAWNALRKLTEEDLPLDGLVWDGLIRG